MKTIEFNGRKMSIGASEERVLRTLRHENWAAKKAEFVEGSTPRYQNTIVPKNRARQTDLGISEISRKYHRGSAREKMFFQENPRCQWGIFGNPRRINAILNKIDALDAEKIEHKLSSKRQDEAKLQKLELFLAGLE